MTTAAYTGLPLPSHRDVMCTDAECPASITAGQSTEAVSELLKTQLRRLNFCHSIRESFGVARHHALRSTENT